MQQTVHHLFPFHRVRSRRCSNLQLGNVVFFFSLYQSRVIDSAWKWSILMGKRALVMWNRLRLRSTRSTSYLKERRMTDDVQGAFFCTWEQQWVIFLVFPVDIVFYLVFYSSLGIWMPKPSLLFTSVRVFENLSNTIFFSEINKKSRSIARVIDKLGRRNNDFSSIGYRWRCRVISLLGRCSIDVTMGRKDVVITERNESEPLCVISLVGTQRKIMTAEGPSFYASEVKHGYWSLNISNVSWARISMETKDRTNKKKAKHVMNTRINSTPVSTIERDAITALCHRDRSTKRINDVRKASSYLPLRCDTSQFQSKKTSSLMNIEERGEKILKLAGRDWSYWRKLLCCCNRSWREGALRSRMSHSRRLT